MKTKSVTPRLIVCAALWSLEGHPHPKREWSLKRKLDAIQAAGFDGVCACITPELQAGASERRLKLMCGFDASDFKSARTRLEEQRALGAHFINIQLLNHDTPPAQAAALAVKLIKLSRELGLGVHIETHRDTATETPEKFTEIARLYRKATGELLPVTWDHSHFAVSKHVLPKHYSERLLVWPELIQHSQMFHLRPFNSQHCQIPVTNGRGRLTPEFLDYLRFAEDLFAVWLAGPEPRRDLWMCPELGTSVGYNVSTNPPVWPDAIRCREELLAAWNRALRRSPSTRQSRPSAMK